MLLSGSDLRASGHTFEVRKCRRTRERLKSVKRAGDCTDW